MKGMPNREKYSKLKVTSIDDELFMQNGWSIGFVSGQEYC